jgi:hypothetical protein
MTSRTTTAAAMGAVRPTNGHESAGTDLGHEFGEGGVVGSGPVLEAPVLTALKFPCAEAGLAD